MKEIAQEPSYRESREIMQHVGDKYTNFSLLPCFAVSLIGGSITLAIAYLLDGYVPFFHDLILERGVIQYITVYSFWLTMGMLLFKWRNLGKERGAFSLDFIRAFTRGRDVAGTKTILAEHEAIQENLDVTDKDLILVNRINKAIKHLRINNNPSDVANVLRTVGETDAAIVDSSYVLIKFMIWAIPVLGFIGTILGMTDAIGSFDAVLKGISEVGFAGMKQSLGQVTSGLAVAFETTFLALVLSTILNLIANALQKREEDLLSDVEVFTTENIINKYSSLRDRISGSLTDPALEPSQTKAGNLNEAMLRELKNMNKQNQVNADNFMSQLGAVVEALNGNRPVATSSEKEPSTDSEGATTELKEVKALLGEQNELLRALAQSASSGHDTSDALQQLPAALEELTETSRKLGDLFSKIYNRTFA